MKITKSRLLEIIKEEVALFNHSKQKQELYEFNMVDLVEMLDEEDVSKKEFEVIYFFYNQTILMTTEENKHSDLIPEFYLFDI